MHAKRKNEKNIKRLRDGKWERYKAISIKRLINLIQWINYVDNIEKWHISYHALLFNTGEVVIRDALLGILRACKHRFLSTAIGQKYEILP